ncbi:MAG: hypothetical protein IJW43_00015 [Clostridia bacterium]|nr:hypothetical protein [Clostridia bacterium]
MIKNKNYVGVILTFLVTALLLFTAFISSSYIPTKAEETKCKAQILAENTVFVGFTPVKYNGGNEGVAFVSYFSLDYFSYTDETYGTDWVYGVGSMRTDDFYNHSISGDYLSEAERLGLDFSCSIDSYDGSETLQEHFNGTLTQTNGGFYLTQRTILKEEKWDISITYFIFYVDLNTNTKYYIDPHFATYSKLSTNNDTVDLSKYISIEESNNKLADKQSEIDKLKTEIEQLKKGTITENTSSNVFMIVSLVFVLILVVAVVSALTSKNKMKK